VNKHTCKDCIDFIDAYIDGSLDPAMRAEFEMHLEKCPPCIEYVKGYERAVKNCKSLCGDDPTPCCEIPEELIRAIIESRGKGA